MWFFHESNKKYFIALEKLSSVTSRKKKTSKKVNDCCQSLTYLWAIQDSNLGPLRYQHSALTNWANSPYLFYAQLCIKANDGNRTRIASLEGWNSTIELHSHRFSLMPLLAHLWRWTESNRRHYELQSYALPTELQRHLSMSSTLNGHSGARTRDLLRDRQAS